MWGGSLSGAMESETLAPILFVCWVEVGCSFVKGYYGNFSGGFSYGAGVRVKQKPDMEMNCDYVGVVYVVNHMSALAQRVTWRLRSFVALSAVEHFLYAIHLKGIGNTGAYSFHRFSVGTGSES